MDTIETIEGYFKDKSEVILVYVFGSIVSDHMTEESDIDIAILFRHLPDFKYFLNIKDNLSELVKREADIVVLNNASPIIKMQVLKKGILVVNKDRSIYNDFFVKTIKEYGDLKQKRKEAEQNILRGRIYA